MGQDQWSSYQKSLRKEGWPEHSLAHPDEILPGIWVSGIAFTDDLPSWCAENNFTHLLNACGSPGREGFYKTHPHDHGLSYLELEMLDQPKFNIRPYMQNVYTFMNDCESARGKILIHCMWGQSRSVSCLVYYLMKRYQIDYDTALNIVQFVRPEAYPNSGFQRQLQSV